MGDVQGEAEGEEGKEAELRAGSGVQEGGVHLEEWVAVVVKLSLHCHHLLTTQVTDFARVKLTLSPDQEGLTPPLSSSSSFHSQALSAWLRPSESSP